MQIEAGVSATGCLLIFKSRLNLGNQRLGDRMLRKHIHLAGLDGGSNEIYQAIQGFLNVGVLIPQGRLENLQRLMQQRLRFCQPLLLDIQRGQVT